MARRVKVDVYKTIKESIQFLEMEPGSKIIEANIAESLGVSRTPVREALKRLEEEHYIDIYPQKGTYVSLIDMNYVKEINYMRHVLECDILCKMCKDKPDVMPFVEDKLLMMQLALKNKDYREYIKQDMKFHQALFEQAGHGAIWNHMSDLLGHYVRVLIMDMMIADNQKDSYESHLQIVEALKEGDREKLSKLLENHHDHRMTDTDKQIMQQNKQYFADTEEPGEAVGRYRVA